MLKECLSRKHVVNRFLFIMIRQNRMVIEFIICLQRNAKKDWHWFFASERSALFILWMTHFYQCFDVSLTFLYDPYDERSTYAGSSLIRLQWAHEPPHFFEQWARFLANFGSYLDGMMENLRKSYIGGKKNMKNFQAPTVSNSKRRPWHVCKRWPWPIPFLYFSNFFPLHCAVAKIRYSSNGF